MQATDTVVDVAAWSNDGIEMRRTECGRVDEASGGAQYVSISQLKLFLIIKAYE